MPRIFISYRRSDSPYVAQSIYERLAAHYGEAAVFFDVRKIPPGVDFPTYLNDNLSECQVLLAIIGPTWLNVTDSQGHRRLDNPKDWVRQEIERALSQPNMLVIPVLVNNTSLPRAPQLPASLSPLTTRNKHPVRPGRDFSKDIEWLIDDLGQYFAQQAAKRQAAEQHRQQEAERQAEQRRREQAQGLDQRRRIFEFDVVTVTSVETGFFGFGQPQVVTTS